jgi:hypothetical protein
MMMKRDEHGTTAIVGARASDMGEATSGPFSARAVPPRTGPAPSTPKPRWLAVVSLLMACSGGSNKGREAPAGGSAHGGGVSTGAMPGGGGLGGSAGSGPVMEGGPDTGGPNLVVSCNAFNTGSWTQVGGPGYATTLVADPNGTADALQVTFTDPRSGFYQVLDPTLKPSTTYTATVHSKLFGGTPNFYIGYYDGSHPITQYSGLITPTASWRRSSAFTFHTGAGDAAPAIAVVNANVDGASQGNDGVVALWGLSVEEGGSAGPFQGCAEGPGRNYAFVVEDHASTWTPDQGWSSQPWDLLHAGTDAMGGGSLGGDTYFGGAWNPVPAATSTTTARGFLYSIQYGAPASMGGNSWPGYLDMLQAAQGAYDAPWSSWLKADAAAAVGPVVVVRIWQEINGNWMLWSTNNTGNTISGTANGVTATVAPGEGWPAAWIVAGWRNMAKLVRQVWPKALIEWNLNPGTISFWNGSPTGATAPAGFGADFGLYPGDDLVDVCGIDEYEVAYAADPPPYSWPVSPASILAFAMQHNKLCGISETASNTSSNTQDCHGDWPGKLAAILDGWGDRAAYASWYDFGRAGNGGDILWSTSGADSCPPDGLRKSYNQSSFGQKAFKGTWSPLLAPR